MEKMVYKQTRDGDTVHNPVSRNCIKCQYRKDNICKLIAKVIVDYKIKPEWCPCKKVIGYIRKPRTECVNCKYNKYNANVYKTDLIECKHCCNYKERNAPYYVEIPVFEERVE